MLRKLYKSLEPYLAIIGVIAAVIGIYQGYVELVANKKSLDATFKYKILADDASVFNAQSVLRPEIAGFQRIVAYDVLMWNSGEDVISEGDVRTPVTVQIEQSAKIIDMKIGSEKTGRTNNVQFAPVEDKTYRLSWNYLDPQDFFEAHFLIATNRDRSALNNIIRMEGAVVKGASLKVESLEDRMETRKNWAFVLASVFVAFSFFISKRILDWELKTDAVIKPKWGTLISIPAIALFLFVVVILPATAAVFLGCAASNLVDRPPLWMEAQYFPPVIFESSAKQ